MLQIAQLAPAPYLLSCKPSPLRGLAIFSLGQAEWRRRRLRERRDFFLIRPEGERLVWVAEWCGSDFILSGTRELRAPS